jgi:hypothetical protein
MSRQVTTSSLETIGHIVGFAEERDNRPYDDGHVVPHRFTVFVPGIGPSLYCNRVSRLGHKPLYLFCTCPGPFDRIDRIDTTSFTVSC